jgi:5'-phosphate synthase pdxT subunit
VKVGILALQGAVEEHARALADVGAHPVEVRVPDDLADVEALVLPGGESTTIALLLASSGLGDALVPRLAAGMPALGTCAGMILLAREVLDGRPGQHGLGAIDLAVRRNGYGRQVDSFEAPVQVEGLGEEPFPGVFIRAPVVEAVGEGVEVLATVDGRPVLCRQGRVLASAFHPELTSDRRVHERFLALAEGPAGATAAGTRSG